MLNKTCTFRSRFLYVLVFQPLGCGNGPKKRSVFWVSWGLPWCGWRFHFWKPGADKIEQNIPSRKLTYCWWTKSCTTKDDEYPIIYRVLTIPGGAGFCPSTVSPWCLAYLSRWFLPFPQVGYGSSLEAVFLGGGFNCFFSIFTPIPGEMIQFDEHIFQGGWFNHQLESLYALQNVLYMPTFHKPSMVVSSVL